MLHLCQRLLIVVLGWGGVFLFAFLEGDGVLNNDEELIATVLSLVIGTWSNRGPAKACHDGLHLLLLL
jgi:hypothetical protein